MNLMKKVFEFKRHIGIDPDMDKSGYAMIEGEVQVLANLTFWELYDRLNESKVSTLVFIEAGWLNKGNWHLHPKLGRNGCAEAGRRTGLNHATGILIVQMCEYLGLPYRLIRPTQSKMDSKYFNKVTGWSGKSNQEQRDAMMLIYGLKQQN